MAKGRPTKFKADMLKEAENLCGLGFTEECLATYWDVSSETVRRWKRRNPDLCVAIEKGKLGANITVTQKLFNKCKDGNLTAIIFWLTNRAPDVWADRRALVNNTNIINNKVGANGNLEGEDAQFRDEMRQRLSEYFK